MNPAWVQTARAEIADEIEAELGREISRLALATGNDPFKQPMLGNWLGGIKVGLDIARGKDPRGTRSITITNERNDTDHDCATCIPCLHNGNRCCGCYDGTCCQETRVGWQDETLADLIESAKQIVEDIDGGTCNCPDESHQNRMHDLAADVVRILRAARREVERCRAGRELEQNGLRNAVATIAALEAELDSARRAGA